MARDGGDNAAASAWSVVRGGGRLDRHQRGAVRTPRRVKGRPRHTQRHAVPTQPHFDGIGNLSAERRGNLSWWQERFDVISRPSWTDRAARSEKRGLPIPVPRPANGKSRPHARSRRVRGPDATRARARFQCWRGVVHLDATGGGVRAIDTPTTICTQSGAAARCLREVGATELIYLQSREVRRTENPTLFGGGGGGGAALSEGAWRRDASPISEDERPGAAGRGSAGDH